MIQKGIPKFVAHESGFYQLSIVVAKCALEYKSTHNLPIAFNQYPGATGRFVFLYTPIPAGVRSVFLTSGKQINFTTLYNKPIESKQVVKNTYEILIPKGVEMIKFQERSSVVDYQNIPNLFFLSPESTFATTKLTSN